MNGAVLLAFAASFIAGPLIYVGLQRVPQRSALLSAMAFGAIAAMAAAIALQPSQPVLSLTVLWVAWVLAISLVVQSLRRRLVTARAGRTSFLTGLLATTLPWFGLATAQLVVS